MTHATGRLKQTVKQQKQMKGEGNRETHAYLQKYGFLPNFQCPNLNYRSIKGRALPKHMCLCVFGSAPDRWKQHKEQIQQRNTWDGVYSVCGLRVRNPLCKSSSVPSPCTHTVYGGGEGVGGITCNADCITQSTDLKPCRRHVERKPSRA